MTEGDKRGKNRRKRRRMVGRKREACEGVGKEKERKKERKRENGWTEEVKMLGGKYFVRRNKIEEVISSRRTRKTRDKGR